MKTLQEFKQSLLNKIPFKAFNRKHDKLFEFDIENYHEGQSFFSNYIGNTILSLDSNEGNASNCISKIIEASKAFKNKNQKKVMMHVSIKGFKISDCDTGSSVVDASIYRISYVTVSQTHKHVYAFVYQNPQTKLIECHAFDCRTKNYAKRILRASFIAFNLAFDRYYKETDNIQRAILLKETKAFNLNELKDFQNENNYNNLEVNLTQDSKIYFI